MKLKKIAIITMSKKMKRKVISCCMSIMMLLSLSAVNVSADDISIYVNEKPLQCDVAPFIKDGRIMVPMREIFEELNARVTWYDELQTISVEDDYNSILLQINNPVLFIFKFGEIEDDAILTMEEVDAYQVTETLDVAPMIVDGVTFVPIRAVSQALNYSVDWLEDTRTVYINSPIIYEEHKDAYTKMYAGDGRTMYVKNSEIKAYQNVGWYLEPVTLMYATDGRTMYVGNSEIEAYQNVGWYLSPVITVYASDGRTMLIYEYELSDYLKVGWYKTYNEAQAAAKPANSSLNNSSYKPSNNNQTNSGSNITTKSSHLEHSFWAEEGAVIVSFKPSSSVVKYKVKCPACGKVGNGTRTTSVTGSKHKTSAVCSNSKCIYWGKSFDVVIGHSSTYVDD